MLRFNPDLPPEVERLDMRLRYRGHSLDLRLGRDTLTVRGHDTPAAPIRLAYREEEHTFAGGSTRTFQLAVPGEFRGRFQQALTLRASLAGAVR